MGKKMNFHQDDQLALYRQAEENNDPKQINKKDA